MILSQFYGFYTLAILGSRLSKMIIIILLSRALMRRVSVLMFLLKSKVS